MPIPATVPQTVAGHLEFLGDQINLADKMWTHYAWAVSKAYATAYKKHMATLGHVKKALERQKQEDYNRMSFALSVLTVGVAGGVGGAVARFMYEKERNLQDAAKDVIKSAMQMRGALIDSLSPDKVVADVFAPDDTTPEEYTTKLFEGITYNVALLTEIYNAVKWDRHLSGVTYDGQDIRLKSGGQLSLNEAKNLTQTIVDSSFMTEMPPLEVTSEALTPKALLSLWIGWALARDAKYWNVPSTNANEYYGKGPMRGDDLCSTPPGFHEQYYWEPVRHELATLGVPTPTITAKIIMQDLGWGASQDYKEFPGLYMWGFMQWATSPQAVGCLFDRSLPQNAKGFEKVKEQMSRRKLGPHGWIDKSP